MRKVFGNNLVANIIKGFALFILISGLIAAIGIGYWQYDWYRHLPDFFLWFVITAVGALVSAIFIYSLGEIIQKLQNIEDNTK